MAGRSMALSTARRCWMLFCDEMGTGPRWPFGNIWAAAAKASQEDICHQCPPSIRLLANQVISLLFLAGVSQKHRLCFQYSGALQKQMHLFKNKHTDTATLCRLTPSFYFKLKRCTVSHLCTDPVMFKPITLKIALRIFMAVMCKVQSIHL